MANSPTFGERLRELRAERELSADKLARALIARGVDITAAAITAWERGEYGGKRKTQQRREVIEAIDAELEADGELVAAFGFPVNGSHAPRPTTARLDALEREVAALRADLSRLLEHPRRPGRGGRP